MTTNYTNKNIVFLGGTETCKDRFANTYVNAERKRSVNGTRDITTTQALAAVKNRTWLLNFLHLEELQFPDSPTTRSNNDAVKDADGIVLLYYVTSRQSFDDITQTTYKQIWRVRRPPTRWLENDPSSPRGLNGLPEPDYPGSTHRFGSILLGLNFERSYKERKVSRQEAKDWAESQGMRALEIDGFGTENVERVMRTLIRSMVWAKTRDAEDVAQDRPASSFDDILGRLPGYY